MWLYKDMEVKTLDDLEEIAGYELPFGFVYLINYVDDTYYIGKKQAWGYKEAPALKFDKIRKRHVCFVTRRKKRSMIKMERYIIEHNWQDYEGSHKEERPEIDSKLILGIGRTKRHLTYLEARYLFLYDVLEDENSRNRNILGAFFRGNIR